MRYKISWAENKLDGQLKEVTAIGVDGVEVTGTIWKQDKMTKAIFPKFDELMPGSEFEATAWKNPTNGKTTFYPPKPASTGNFKPTGSMVKAQAVKTEQIKVAQENKAEGIKTSSTARMATDMCIAYPKDEMSPEETWLYWRNFTLKNWDLPDAPPF